MSVLALAGAIALAGPSPGRIRAIGLLLQLLGLTVVTLEVIRVWRRARTPVTRDWFHRLASAFRSEDPRQEIATDRAAARAPTAATLAKVPPGASVEQRVRTLEKNIEEVRRETARALRAQEKTLGDVRQAVARDVQARLAALDTARRALDDQAGASVPLELVGLAWLWVGTVALLAADDMAALLSWLAG